MSTNSDVNPTTAQVFDPLSFPYNSIVRIIDTIGASRYQSSGVLISPDELLTANHVSYKSGSSNGVATAIDVALTTRSAGTASDASSTTHYTGVVTHYFPIVDDPTIALPDVQSDYSLIHLAQPVSGGATMRVTGDFPGGVVHVTGFPAASDGTMIDDVQSIATDPNYTIYEGSALGAGSSGSPVWATGTDGVPTVFGVVSSASGNTAYDVKFTAAEAAQITAWAAADDGTPATSSPTAQDTPSVVIYDVTTGTAMPDETSKPYAGPVPGLQSQFVKITTDSLNITATAPNLFIHTGSGNDAIALLGGTNVVDGGAGSNFMTGGKGTDTFFVDARDVAADIWNTVSGFRPGDAVTLWGLSAGTSLNWVNVGGAAGYTGLTLHASIAGGATASLTLAGMSQADMASGKITTQFGHDAASGSDYLYVRDAAATT